MNKEEFMDKFAGRVEEVLSELAEAEEGFDLNRVVVAFDFKLDSEEFFGFSAIPKTIQPAQVVDLFYEITVSLMSKQDGNLMSGNDN